MYQNGTVNSPKHLRSLNACMKAPKSKPDTLQTGKSKLSSVTLLRVKWSNRPVIEMPGCEQQKVHQSVSNLRF